MNPSNSQKIHLLQENLKRCKQLIQNLQYKLFIEKNDNIKNLFNAQILHANIQLNEIINQIKNEGFDLQEFNFN
jgi:hypothetical protein